eukprot:m.95687 g.95687  ORF g.95687 m.95687 type:complete len:87 (+) comp36861_c0_seq8:84-344(+)
MGHTHYIASLLLANFSGGVSAFGTVWIFIVPTRPRTGSSKDSVWLCDESMIILPAVTSSTVTSKANHLGHLRDSGAIIAVSLCHVT